MHEQQVMPKDDGEKKKKKDDGVPLAGYWGKEGVNSKF